MQDKIILSVTISRSPTEKIIIITTCKSRPSGVGMEETNADPIHRYTNKDSQ